jgi:hypothetical protein
VEEVELAEMNDRGLLDRALEGEVELLERLVGGEARGLDAGLAAVAVAAVDLGLLNGGDELMGTACTQRDAASGASRTARSARLRSVRR